MQKCWKGVCRDRGLEASQRSILKRNACNFFLFSLWSDSVQHSEGGGDVRGGGGGLTPNRWPPACIRPCCILGRVNHIISLVV